MPRGARKQCESDIYHVFIRGVGKQLVFEDDQDRETFLELIVRFVGEDVSLLAWVLMGNHIHLVLRGPLGSISSFMQRIETVYSGYFNGRHGRTGHLFQGRFGSEGIKDDQQLLAALRYVHQNPARAGMSDGCDYEWSSYREYIGEPTCVPALCNTAFVLALFDGSIAQFKRFHEVEETMSLQDVEGSHRRYERISDAQALRIADQMLGEGWKEALSDCAKAERDKRLRMLKRAGLSVRQIERITGIGRGIIQRS